jgi:hypothetical protein
MRAPRVFFKESAIPRNVSANRTCEEAQDKILRCRDRKRTESKASEYEESTWAFAGRETSLGAVISTSLAI